MSREMRVFVSLIVWLFSITGRDGLLDVKPSHFVVMEGTSLTLLCNSDSAYPAWQEKKTFLADTDQVDSVVRYGCVNPKSRDYTVNKYEEESYYYCDLTVNPTAAVFSDRLSTFFVCEDFDDGKRQTASWAILIVLRAPLKCGTKGKALSCKLQHSAYLNASVMHQYLEIRLELKNPKGEVVSNKTAGFMDDNTVVTAALDDGQSFSPTNPYSCSASFIARCYSEFSVHCVSQVEILPPSATECKCKESDWDMTQPEKTKARVPIRSKTAGKAKSTETSKNDEADEAEEEEDGVEERVAIIITNGTAIILHPGSNAKLERDGIDAIAMVTCLLAAFLVH